MPRKKWITKKETSDILRSYSIRPDEFEQAGADEYFFKSKYTRGYTISIRPEILQGDVKTGRTVVSHTKNGGKRTFQDIWERDAGNKLQFVFRNPWNRPFADYKYIKDLENQISELKEAGQKQKDELEEYRKLFSDTAYPKEPLSQLQQENDTLKAENESLRSQIASLKEKCRQMPNTKQHNARGAGRKPDPERMKAQAEKVKALLEDEKEPSEIQRIMGISRSTFFRYKRLIKT